jgi:hypothetical protein
MEDGDVEPVLGQCDRAGRWRFGSNEPAADGPTLVGVRRLEPEATTAVVGERCGGQLAGGSPQLLVRAVVRRHHRGRDDEAVGPPAEGAARAEAAVRPTADLGAGNEVAGGVDRMPIRYHRVVGVSESGGSFRRVPAGNTSSSPSNSPVSYQQPRSSRRTTPTGRSRRSRWAFTIGERFRDRGSADSPIIFTVPTSLSEGVDGRSPAPRWQRR